MDYRFLVEITKIENATFASVRKASVKANRMGSTSAYSNALSKTFYLSLGSVTL